MKIVLAPVGTRGDIQPMLALALALKKRSHDVIFCAEEAFRSWTESLGLTFEASGEHFANLFRGDADLIDQGTWLMKRLARQVPEQFRRLEEVAKDADVLVGGMLQFAGPSIAEIFHIPYFYAVYWPLLLQSYDHPTIGVPWQKAPRWFNALTWFTHKLAWNLVFKKKVNKQRTLRGLDPVEDVHRYFVYSGHQLLAYDPELSSSHQEQIAKPTGYWFLEDENGSLDSELETFLEEGPPPIYLGFGSMKASDPARVMKILADSAIAAGQRALIRSESDGIRTNNLPTTCRVIRSVPHQSLFPRVSVVVHHGGAGTTATALSAGIPQIIVPHLCDQFYWGHQVHLRGIGPKPIHRFLLSVSRLSSAIQKVRSNRSFHENARQFAQQIQRRNGVAEAVRLIEEICGRDARATTSV